MKKAAAKKKPATSAKTAALKNTAPKNTAPRGTFAADGAPEPDLKAATRLALELMAIPGTSGEERQVAQFITEQLRAAGAARSAIATDEVFKKTTLGGNVGNLVFTLPGTLAGPRRLLMAHMDTVPLCVGCKPVVKGRFVHSANRATGLGADDRGGCAVVLTAALEILRRKLPHPPLTFFWPVQEEVGLYGVRHMSLTPLQKPKLAFNWDGGAADKLTVGATGAFRIMIEIEGIASHAGGAPEQGVSAISIAALAIADLFRDGWLGDVQKDGRRGTSNVGIIQAGAATNVITPHATVRAEARSHDTEFRLVLLNAIEHAFERAAHEVTNVNGDKGKVTCTHRLDYDAFKLADHEASVVAAESAVSRLGLTPVKAITNGGLDANWLSARGIPTVTLGCGQTNVHTVNERLDLEQFEQACRIGLRLATATEAGST